jgi:hypothetical protein
MTGGVGPFLYLADVNLISCPFSSFPLIFIFTMVGLSLCFLSQGNCGSAAACVFLFFLSFRSCFMTQSSRDLEPFYNYCAEICKAGAFYRSCRGKYDDGNLFEKNLFYFH